MRHEDLVRRTIEYVEKFFIAQPQQIKKRIEDLITREFLERDENETSVYKYRA